MYKVSDQNKTKVKSVADSLKKSKVNSWTGRHRALLSAGTREGNNLLW